MIMTKIVRFIYRIYVKSTFATSFPLKYKNQYCLILLLYSTAVGIFYLETILLNNTTRQKRPNATHNQNCGFSMF